MFPHKPIHLHQLLFTLLLSLVGVCFATPGRVEQDFNFDWQFHLGDKKKSADWQAVRLPHDWPIAQGFSREKTGCSTGFLPGGVGWYRKEFKSPIYKKQFRGRHEAREFENDFSSLDRWRPLERTGKSNHEDPGHVS